MRELIRQLEEGTRTVFSGGGIMDTLRAQAGMPGDQEGRMTADQRKRAIHEAKMIIRMELGYLSEKFNGLKRSYDMDEPSLLSMYEYARSLAMGAEKVQRGIGALIGERD